MQLFNLDDEHKSKAYQILASLVTPRPIAWTTTRGTDGTINAAPFSFFNVFGTRPPVVIIAPGDKEPGIPKDTARNIRETGVFVIHLVDEPLLQKMNVTAATRDYGDSELEGLSLTLGECDHVSVPRIIEAPAALECREHSTLRIGMNRLVIGRVHRVWAKDGLFDPETMRFDQAQYAPIGRMGSPDWYARTSDQISLPRPD
ncbi:MAG: flavin reductase family protein [Verrucomicrobiota bacterium]